VLAVALWPASAQARVDASRGGSEQPRLWGVEIGTHARTFARPTNLSRMKHAGVNAVVLDPRRLTLKELRSTVKAAEGARLWVIELVPPAHAKATRSVKAVRATCRASSKPAQTLCASSTASLSAALALSSSSGSAGPMVAVRLAGPAQVARLGGVSSSGSQILALVKLGAHRFAAPAWRRAIAVAATTSSLDLAVTPTGSSNQALSPYLNQLGKPPSAPASFGVTGSTASTISVAWAAVVGATEYDLTANGTFAGKTATTSFTVGGLACSTAYKLAVTAKNAAGKTSKASTLTTSTAPCSDVTPPTTPTGLTEMSSTQTSATVAWASSTDNIAVTGYGVTVDGNSVGTTAATTYNVSGLTCGSTHTVAVDAFDAAGNHSTRTSISASTSVCSDSTPPNVTVTAPTAGATVSGTVPVTANASDNVAVASVEFWVDGTKVATDTSAPYSYGWNTTQVPGGPHTILVKAVDTSNNTASTTDGVTVSNSPCATSSTSWQNTPMLTPNGTFDVSFDAIPSATNIDAVTGLSAAPALAYTDLAVIARFNSTGTIDAINGGGYAAANAVPYVGGSTYHFRAAVDVPNHVYSLYVTPPGKPETPVALNYAFRTGQTGVTALSNWAVTAAAGSHQTCGLAVSSASDMTAPSIPTGLAKTSSTQTSLSLSWAASTDNVGTAGYTVYVNGTANSAASGTSRTVSGLSCGSTYTVGVDAYDAAGNHSAQTSTTMSTGACPDTTPPSTPTNLQKSGSTTTSVTVSWTGSTDNVGVTGYTLYVNGAQIGTTTGTSMTATGLACGTTYTVAVDAFDAAGNHSAKASISASTAACSDTTPPSTPSGLTTSAISQTSLTLSWTASTDNVGVTGYRLYLGGSQVGTSTSTSYVFSGLSCGTSYTLGVAAVDAAGNVSGTATLGAATATCSGGGGSTFDCYGANASCYTALACTTTISSGLQTAIANAAAGAVICLSAAGSPYPTLSTSAVKSADVTIQAAPGASVSIGGLNLTGTSHLVFQNLTSTGASVYGATHTHLRYISFTGSSLACTSSSCGTGVVANADVSFEHDRFDNIQNGTYEARLAFRGQDNNITASGFTVSDSHFGGTGLNGGWGGCSDGVGLVGSVTAVTIGPGNEFDHLQQGSCGSINGAHVDPIQFYGATNTLVTGNWFHNNGDGSGGIMSPDGDDGYTVSNNVFDQTGMYAYAVDVEGCSGCTVSHNVIRNANVFAGVSNGGSPTSNLIVRDNLFQNGGIGSEGSATFTASYNLNCSCSGLGNITGTPIYTGGTNPTTYGGFHLASGSPGKGAASDGTDMGIR